MATEMGTAIEKEDSAEKTARKAVSEAEKGLNSGQPDFAVLFVSPEYDVDEVLEVVKEASGAPKVIGCTSAGEFTEKEVKEGSLALALISSDQMKFFTAIGSGISGDPHSAVQEAASQLPDEVEDHPHMAGINLHDGLRGVGETVSQFAYFEKKVPFAGGSAADDLKMEETRVLTEEGSETDAVALAVIASEKPFSFAVGHGHSPLSDGLEVTDADGSTINELEGRPAIEVWRDVIEEKAREQFGIDVRDLGEEEFKKLLLMYELGIETGDGEYRVRWPGLTAGKHGLDGPIELAVRIEEGTEVHVMSTTHREEIESTGRVASRAREEMDSWSGALVFDCVCHASILEDDFGEATHRIRDELESPFAGFESYGEVCHSDQAKIRGYHNTTTSLLLFPD
ncbi:MAG: FIST signal transduction protein [Candidatus Nanohaloarchaea archaeon]